MTPALRSILFPGSDIRMVRTLLAQASIATEANTTTTRATGLTCPITDTLLGNNVPSIAPMTMAGVRVPFFGSWGTRTNLFLNSAAPATQNITVVAGSVTVHASRGTGYTITTSAGTATISGHGPVAIGVPQTITVTVGGTITVTIEGTPVGARVQVEAGAVPTPYIPTAGASVTHNFDQHLFTPPGGLLAASGTVLAMACPYLFSMAANGAHPSGVGSKIVDPAGTDTDTMERATTTDVCRKRDTATQIADASDAIAWDNGQVHSLAQCWDSNGLYFWRDGILAGTDVALAGPWNARANIVIGNRWAGNRPTDMFVAVMKWNRVLSGPELATITRVMPKRIAFAA